MHVKPRLAARTAALGVALAAVLVPIAGATSAHATVAPSITVTPHTGLHDTDVVTVAGANYTADEGQTVYVLQCSGTTGQADCNLGGLAMATVAADGTFSTTLEVHTGTIGDGTCAAGSSNCVIAAGDPLQTEKATASIGFAAPPAPAITVTPSHGLSDGDSVTVAGANFTADEGNTVYLVECSGTSGQAACDTVRLAPVTVAPDGTFSGSLTVHMTGIGNGSCASGATNCFITASDAGQVESATASIGFGPYITVTPSSNLKAGQTVTVSGADFPPAISLYVLQCGANPGAAGEGCNTGDLGNPTTSATGTFSGVKIKVVSKAGNQTCDFTHPCVIAASNGQSGKSAVGTSAAITFAKVPAPTKVKTATAAKASAKSVKKGKKFTISGTVKAGKSGVKGLKESLYAGKKKVASATSGAGGKFSFKLKGAKKTTKYYVSTAAKTIGSKAYQASKSKTITVKHKK
jgi:Neocarzinostatin family